MLTGGVRVGATPTGGGTHRRLQALAGLTVLAGIAISVALVDPRRPGSYPTCPFHAVTGLSCPGCGSLRATHALVTGNLPEALGYNALAVLTLPVLVVFWLRIAVFDPPARRTPGQGAIALLVVITIWSIARNLPGPLSALAP